MQAALPPSVGARAPPTRPMRARLCACDLWHGALQVAQADATAKPTGGALNANEFRAFKLVAKEQLTHDTYKLRCAHAAAQGALCRCADAAEAAVQRGQRRLLCQAGMHMQGSCTVARLAWHAWLGTERHDGAPEARLLGCRKHGPRLLAC